MESAIIVDQVNKVYKLYHSPQDRLKEAFSLTHRSYHEDFIALSNVSFSVERGETLGIIGKNGAGKSTLLKLITGVASPTSGVIQVNGQVSALLELGTGFNPEFNGYQNIYLNGTMRGYTKEQMDQKMDEIISFADIGEYMSQPVKTYSSGMFARLAFAVMISFKPEILIIDEALSVGDVFFQQKCNTYMKEKMQGVTKLLVTHDMNSVANMADRVILLDHGKIVRIGEPLKVIEEYLKMMHTEVFAGHGESYTGAEQKDIPVSQGNDDWIDVTPDETAGALDVIIEKFILKINGVITDVGKPGDCVQIHVMIYSKKNCGNLILGYTFKDKYGNSIFAQNTLGAGIRVSDIQAGGHYVLTVQFNWPKVREGDYFLTLGIGEGEDQMVHTIQCWAHNVIHIQGIALVPMHGIINHTIDKFKLARVSI